MMLILTAVFLLTVSVSYSQKVEYSLLSDSITANRLTKAAADSIFQFILSKGDVIEFSDCNICKSRAHIITRAIEMHYPGVSHGKAWLFADSKRSSRREEYRYKPETYLRYNSECRSWGYHVAPVIVTEKDTFIIDPATQTSAVTLRQWAESLVPAGSAGFLVIKRAEYFIFPDDSNNLFEDEKKNWVDSGENLFDESYSRSIDEITRASLGLTEPWKMNERVKKIKLLLGIK